MNPITPPAKSIEESEKLPDISMARAAIDNAKQSIPRAGLRMAIKTPFPSATVRYPNHFRNSPPMTIVPIMVSIIEMTLPSESFAKIIY